MPGKVFLLSSCLAAGWWVFGEVSGNAPNPARAQLHESAAFGLGSVSCAP